MKSAAGRPWDGLQDRRFRGADDATLNHHFPLASRKPPAQKNGLFRGIGL
jgi:hypothetical protein